LPAEFFFDGAANDSVFCRLELFIIMCYSKYNKFEREYKIIHTFNGMNISSKDPKRLALFYQDALSILMPNGGTDFDGVEYGFLNLGRK